MDRFSQGDFPGNPVAKPGYVLDFADEFDGRTLDAGKWFPYYLPHWSSRLRSAPRYRLADGCLALQITADQAPWCPEFDGEVKCSSIQTGEYAGPIGSSTGQHRFNSACRVREAQPTLQTYTPRYGYFEMRAKAVGTPGNHVALWMIGYEDAPERSGEIAIFEIMGAHVSRSRSRVGYGVRRWGDPRLRDAFYEELFEIDATCFHVYGLEWHPTHLDFFIDNQKIRTIEQSPDYPMQFMLSIYELPVSEGAAVRGIPVSQYPKEFVIDSFRAYQPEREYDL